MAKAPGGIPTGAAAADDVGHAVSGRLAEGQNQIIFSYFPRTLSWSLPVALLILVACWLALRSG